MISITEKLLFYKDTLKAKKIANVYTLATFV